MFVQVTPDTHWLLKRVQMLMGFWETLDNEDAKEHTLAYLEELEKYLSALDGQYHVPAILDTAGREPRISIKSGIAESCGNEVF